MTWWCHMSTAFLGTKTHPLSEAFESCQGKPIRGSVGLACHDIVTCHDSCLFSKKNKIKYKNRNRK